jgi:hypothetical protein
MGQHRNTIDCTRRNIMTELLQLEQIYRRRHQAYPDDALLYFPVSKITASFEVTEVLPPPNGNIAIDDLDQPIMVMLKPYEWTYPRFKLFYDADEAGAGPLGEEIESQYRPLLRFVSSEEERIRGVWPLAWIKPLDRLPSGWEQQALLVVFEGDYPTQCKIQYCGPAPGLPVAPDACDAYCYPPANLIRWVWCKVTGCI